MRWILPLVAGLVAGATAGGYLGYQKGSEAVTNSAASAMRPEDSLTAGAAPNTGALAGLVTAPTAAERSLAERMDGLLAVPQRESSEKAVADFTLAEVRAALSYLAGKPKSRDRDLLRADLYGRWAVLDPRGAWQVALADPLEDDTRLMSAVAAVWLQTEPDAAFDAMLAIGQGRKRESLIYNAVIDWANKDLRAVIAYGNAHPDLPIPVNFAYVPLLELVKKQPLQAANFALEINNPAARSYALTHVVGDWATLDPAAALQWVESITNPSIRRETLIQAIGSWSAKNPQEALAYAMSLPASDASRLAIATAYSSWMRNAPEAALDYIVKSGGDQAIDAIAEWNWIQILNAMTSSEQTALITRLPESKVRQHVVDIIAKAWIQNGRYSAAVELFNSLPDSPRRDETLVSFGSTWANNDVKAAEAWLAAQPDSSDRDLITSGMVSDILRNDPQSALRWAAGIPDPAIRTPTYKNLYLSWRSFDAPAANAWLATVTEINFEDREKLLNGTIKTLFPTVVSNRR